MSVHNGFMLWTLILFFNFYRYGFGEQVFVPAHLFLCGFCCGDILHVYAFSGIGFVVFVL